MLFVLTQILFFYTRMTVSNQCLDAPLLLMNARPLFKPSSSMWYELLTSLL